MTAPKDSAGLYEAARGDLASPTRDKMLKWIFWTAGIAAAVERARIKCEASGHAARAAAIRGQDDAAAPWIGFEDAVADAINMYEAAKQVRDLLIFAMATCRDNPSRAPEAPIIPAPPATTVAFLPRNANGRTPQE